MQTLLKLSKPNHNITLQRTFPSPMASVFLSSIPLLFLLSIPIITADPDSLQDFCVADTKSSAIFINGFPCLSPSQTSSQHFTTSALNTLANTSGNPFGVGAIATTTTILPGINTLGIQMVRANVDVGGQVPPHTHPRATEMVYILEGYILAGFVDSSNNLFSQKIKAGDVFVFPKGTLHFLHNIGKTPANWITAFNSQNPGVAVTPMVTFAANPPIPPKVLSKAFQVSFEEVGKIRKSLGGS
ncbi:germin-like protein subfamily 1 member 1 [Cryptomeria japonica]|uniref:germin-like protein subfamily 1 member 1 n=1 Tax=Cryptomeria japonica TaxID=3369 RepID=UPI0025AD7BE5|nr:germin-like protein subfamily 1 member 1 [Cryptomeria japonica]